MWKIPDKIGKSLKDLHYEEKDGKVVDGVPATGYKVPLEKKADQFFVNAMKDGKKSIRYTIAVYDNDERSHFPGESKPKELPDDPQEFADQAFLRLERQVFLKLQENDDVSLMILHPHSIPLREAVKVPSMAEALYKIHKYEMTDEHKEYRNLKRFEPQLLAYLEDLGRKDGWLEGLEASIASKAAAREKAKARKMNKG